MAWVTAPRTPIRNGQGLHQLIGSLNEQFALDLPNPHVYSPSVERRNEESLRWKSYNGIKRLYYSRKIDLNIVLNNLEEWIAAQEVSYTNAPRNGAGGWNVSDAMGRLPRAGRERTSISISQEEKDDRLLYLMKLVDDELYLLSQGVSSPSTSRIGQPARQPQPPLPSPPQLLPGPVERGLSEEEDNEYEFHTAPNSPVKNYPDVDEFPDSTLDNANWTPLDPAQMHIAKSPKRGPSRFVERLTAPEPPVRRYDAVQENANANVPQFSFSTTSTSLLTEPRDNNNGLGVSFTSTEPVESLLESETQYEDSVVGHMLSQEMKTTFSTDILGEESGGVQYSVETEIVNELLRNGPFSIERSFPPSISLRYRYELERVARAWDVPFERMLVGSNIPFKTYDDFWKWIAGHNQRNGKLLPERSSRRAWDAATGNFQTDKHSEVVVFSGDLDWCETESEQQQQPGNGILKLKLNPLKTEKTCRFHRRFGSDRFLSLTLPAPTRPPRHLRLPSQPTLLRESLASWLTQHVHRCIGRSWRPFFVEEAKSKRKVKSEPRFKIEFFAVDGEDFDHSHCRLPPSIAPARQESDARTPMSLEALMDWHMPPEANMAQSNCKLFQRISIGLSKTFATVALRPKQVFRLRDEPGQPVMNDGCALISRGLAKEVCDSLGISGNTPSSFQGRIAGAKGLWMVDRHRSHVGRGSGDDDDIWIQISESQLKIKPHPEVWQEPVDEEQLTFEVVKWSKPLHPVALNVQLLGILEHGSGIKEYIAELARAGIEALYRDFAEVLQLNSNVLCRCLIQKLRPADDSSGGLMAHKVRRLELWASSDIEGIARFAEAGFAPQSFYPLRKRLGRCLSNALQRYVDELHIEVPLSTYAFCIADPYGVLKPDEVHFGFSNNWHGAEFGFEDNLLDGMDVLVGRLPAHLPSDIQRRRAVWNPKLRHFKDVIVFPTTGDMPLAHMLSGGDYDGDTPWVCWDQKIVQSFRNSDLPEAELSYPAEHFGLTKHSVPMSEIQSREEFWQKAFTFNLTLSNLGRCTVEHEKISYEESIDSHKAKELACLLGHLVDGRKGGVHLSEQAWQQYRKRISPRARELPAYRNPGRRYNPKNIIDYLKFRVASRKRDTVLRELERQFPEAAARHRDEDLIRPWNEAWELAQRDKEEGGDLHAHLSLTLDEFDTRRLQWNRSFSGESDISTTSGTTMSREFTPMAREAAERAKAIPPPNHGDHPLLHTWRHDPDAWLRVLASCAYKQYPEASFVIHAFGETLCQIKARTMPARTVTNEILACYRLNQKVASQLMAREVPGDLDEDGSGGYGGDGDGDVDEFEGEDAIEACLFGTQTIPGGYYDPDDTMSVE